MRNTSMLVDLGGSSTGATDNLAGQELAYSVSAVQPGSNTYTVAVFNPDYAQHDLKIAAVTGTIAGVRSGSFVSLELLRVSEMRQITEIVIPDNESNETGYVPLGFEQAKLGNDTGVIEVKISCLQLPQLQVRISDLTVACR